MAEIVHPFPHTNSNRCNNNKIYNWRKRDIRLFSVCSHSSDFDTIESLLCVLCDATRQWGVLTLLKRVEYQMAVSPDPNPSTYTSSSVVLGRWNRYSSLCITRQKYFQQLPGTHVHQDSTKLILRVKSRKTRVLLTLITTWKCWYYCYYKTCWYPRENTLIRSIIIFQVNIKTQCQTHQMHTNVMFSFVNFDENHWIIQHPVSKIWKIMESECDWDCR